MATLRKTSAAIDRDVAIAGRQKMQQKFTDDNAVNEDAEALSRVALQHFKEGRPQQAQDICQRILQKKQHSGANLILAWIAHQQRELGVAVERYQQYLAIKPGDAEARYTLGLAFKELQHTELAIEQFEKSIAHVADNADVHRELGDAYARLHSLEEAIKPYQTAIALQADDVVTKINLGHVFHGLRRYTQSVPLYQQALALQPDNFQAHRHLGASLQKMGQLSKALKCFEQALSLRGDYVDARIKLAEVLRELGRAEEALVHVEEAIKLKPDETQAHIILALILRELGRSELAVERFESLLRTNPRCGNLYYQLAMLEPRQEQVAGVENLLGDPQLPIGDSIFGHFALGNIHKGSKSYDQAFDHFLKANTLYRKTYTYDARENSLLIDSLITVYSKRFFQSKRQWGSASQLPVFVLGMPRSGTTLVEQIISSHASVHGAGELQALPAIKLTIAQQLEYANPYPECMSLFDKKMAEEYSQRYLQELALHCSTATRITDKLPGNFFKIGLIKTLFPDARIIHCQRNPLDSCISIFFHYIQDWKWSFDLTELGQYYLDYQRVMSHWQDLFPGEIFTVQYEELVMEQKKISKKLIDYLELEWDEKCLDFHNNKRDVRTISNMQVRKPMYKNSMNRWKHYEKHLQPLIELLGSAR